MPEIGRSLAGRTTTATDLALGGMPFIIDYTPSGVRNPLLDKYSPFPRLPTRKRCSANECRHASQHQTRGALASHTVESKPGRGALEKPAGGSLLREGAPNKAGTFPLACHPASIPAHLSASERLDEIADVLAAGLMRLRVRKSSAFSRDVGESSLDYSADQRGHAHPREREARA